MSSSRIPGGKKKVCGRGSGLSTFKFYINDYVEPSVIGFLEAIIGVYTGGHKGGQVNIQKCDCFPLKGYGLVFNG